MDRIFSKGTLLVFSIMLVVIGCSFLLRGCNSEREVKANVFPREVELGFPVMYRDSTENVKELIWEFGNGDFSTDHKGTYIYTAPGNYKMRVKADGKAQEFVVKVVQKKMATEKKFVRIIAPTTAFVGEGVTFIADGDATDWQWKFGQTGKVDSHEQDVVYHYDVPGNYQVRLISGNMEYPVFHNIQILSAATTRVTTPGGGGDGDIYEPLRQFLQNIVDHRGSYDKNYRGALKFLNNNERLLVVVNNSNENDFYSYCHGLHITGKQHGTYIDMAIPEIEGGKVKRLLVSQRTSN